MSTESEGAGWGVGIFGTNQAQVQHSEETEEPLFKLSGPVVTEKDSHVFLGAEEATNNTGELTAMMEAMIWMKEEAPDGKNVPVTIKFDSEYAAGIIRGIMQPKTNKELASKGLEIYRDLEQTREIKWEWVKGHSEENGNWWADKLADEGKAGAVGQHNKRWAAPPPTMTAKKEWEQEICRKCGEHFQLDARRCAAHEKQCTGRGTPGAGYPGYMKCRKCGELIGDGVENAEALRQVRKRHEKTCTGVQTLS